LTEIGLLCEQWSTSRLSNSKQAVVAAATAHVALQPTSQQHKSNTLPCSDAAFISCDAVCLTCRFIDCNHLMSAGAGAGGAAAQCDSQL
jgi:hypothetical protein